MPSIKLFTRQFQHAGPIYTLQDEGDWVKLNAQQYGFYRVVYPQDMYTELTMAARKGPASLSAADLAGLLDDSYKLAVGGTVPITFFLELSTYMPPAAALVCGEGRPDALMLPEPWALGRMASKCRLYMCWGMQCCICSRLGYSISVKVHPACSAIARLSQL